MGKKRKQSPEKKGAVMRAVRGAIIGLVVTVACVLLFAVVVKETAISDQAIGAINQGIKVVCVFLAAFIASRGMGDGRVFAGVLSGVLYILLGYLTFSLIDGAFGNPLLLLADLALGAIIGMLTAMIFGRIAVPKHAARH